MLPGKTVAKDWLRQTAIDRHEHGLVILVTLVVQHQQDFAKLGQYLEGDRMLEMVWVGQRQIRRHQGFRHAPADVHDIQAEPAGEIADKVEPLAGDLGLDELPCRK